MTHPLGWPAALDPRRSPCRVDAAKGVRQHRCSRSHAEVVDGYRAWREHEREAAEAAAVGYATELEDYWRDHPERRPTFGRFLTESRQERG